MTYNKIGKKNSSKVGILLQKLDYYLKSEIYHKIIKMY